MKRPITFILFLLFTPLLLEAQGFMLTIKPNNFTADSLQLRAFDGKKSFYTLASAPATAPIVLKTKQKLEPGIYAVQRHSDTVPLFRILISESQKLKISATLTADGTPIFENSTENAAYQEYLQKTAYFAHKADSLNQVFAEAQQSLPTYMLQTLAQNLMQEADDFSQQEAEYKQHLIAAHEGTLLASIVQFNKELPPPPQEYYQTKNNGAIRYHFLSHTFDYYPFSDPRMAATDLTTHRLQQFAIDLYYFDPQIAIPLITKLLDDASVNETTYHQFLTILEKIFGSLTSPYFTEEIYIEMLRHALNYKQLEEKRRPYYTQQLELHTKNLPGTTIPDFPIYLSDSTVSTLHAQQGEFILLYFQNPDCPTCSEVRAKLAVDENVNRAIESGKLTVITIYFEEDRDLWDRYLRNNANPKYLHAWDYQQEISNKNLFDLRIIPYMFLLDKDKTILKKDLLYNEIEQVFKYYKIY